MSPGNRVVLAALGGVNSKPCVSLPCRSYRSLLANASELLGVRVSNKSVDVPLYRGCRSPAPAMAVVSLMLC